MQLEHTFTVPVPIDDAWKVLLDVETIAPCMPGAVLDSVDGDAFTGRVKVKLGPISLTYKGKASFVQKDEAAHVAVLDAAGKDQRGNGTAAATVTATLHSEGPSSTKVDVLTDLNITGKPAQFGRGVMVDVGNKLIGQFATCLEGKITGPGEAATGPEDASASAPAAGDPAGAAAGAASSGSANGTAPATDSPAASASAPAATAPAPVAAAPAPAAAAPAPAATAPAPAATAPAPAATSRPAPREPEPIDLFEVAGGSVLTRFGPPAAGLAVLLAVIALIVRKVRS